MRRSVVLATIVALFMLGSALPASADYPPEVTIDPGESVQVIDGIWITVYMDGTVEVIDGIWIRKFAPDGGRPLQISVSNANLEFSIIPGPCVDLKLCA